MAVAIADIISAVMCVKEAAMAIYFLTPKLILFPKFNFLNQHTSQVNLSPKSFPHLNNNCIHSTLQTAHSLLTAPKLHTCYRMLGYMCVRLYLLVMVLAGLLGLAGVDCSCLTSSLRRSTLRSKSWLGRWGMPLCCHRCSS